MEPRIMAVTVQKPKKLYLLVQFNTHEEEMLGFIAADSFPRGDFI
jgi:hypothetical protein